MDKKIIKHLVTTFLKKKFRNPERQKKFLIDCIESNGYIKEGYHLNLNEEESEEDIYQHFMPSGELTSGTSGTSGTQETVTNFPDFQTTFNSPTSVDPYGFNRTFIHADNGGDKLAELQKRGITYEETQFNKVREQMETIISKLNVGKMDNFQERILQTALNIFLNIIIYYRTNPFGFKENKGSLKQGYIFLSIYYALIYNNNFVERERLIEFTDIRLRDIPDAERNIKIIFNGVMGYDFIFNLMDFKKFLKFFSKTVNIDSREFISQIETVIEETRPFIPSTRLGIYSIIYFVGNFYYPFKVKIVYKSTQSSITYALLNEIFEPFASSTVRKLTDQLKTFYKR
jgi:hypothetical protein